MCFFEGESFEKVLAKKDPVRAAALLEVALKHQSDSSSYGRAGGIALILLLFFFLLFIIVVYCCFLISVRNAAHFYEVTGNRERAAQLSEIATKFELSAENLLFVCLADFV